MIDDDILADSFKFFLLQKNNVEKLLVAVNIIVQDPVCVCVMCIPTARTCDLPSSW